MSAFKYSDVARAEILTVASVIHAGRYAWHNREANPEDSVLRALDLIDAVNKHVDENSEHVKDAFGPIYNYRRPR